MKKGSTGEPRRSSNYSLSYKTILSSQLVVYTTLTVISHPVACIRKYRHVVDREHMPGCVIIVGACQGRMPMLEEACRCMGAHARVCGGCLEHLSVFRNVD